MVHVALGLFRPQRVDLLGHLDHVESGDAHDLGLPAFEQRATVRPRDDRHLGAQRADIGDAPAIDPEMVGQDALAHQFLGQRPIGGADLLLASGESLAEASEHIDLDLIRAIVALGFSGDLQSLGQVVAASRDHGRIDVVGVIGEQRVVGDRFGGLGRQLLLRVAQRGDERLGYLKALGHNGFGGRRGAAGDQLDHPVGGFSLDHHDRDVGRVPGAGLAPRDDHVEHGTLELLDSRERHPLATAGRPRDERDANAADGAGERQAGDLGRRRCGIDGEHVVQVVGIEAEDRDNDLDLVAQAGDERRSQWPVDQPTGEDRVGGGAALAAEEGAGNPARGIHPLLDINGQREEVKVLFGGLAGGGGRQQHGFVVEVGDDGAGGLLGQPTGLESDGAGAEAPVVDGGGCFEHAFVDVSDRHRGPYSLSGNSLFWCFASPQRTRVSRNR